MFRMPNIEMSLPVGLILFFVALTAGTWIGDTLQVGYLAEAEWEPHAVMHAEVGQVEMTIVR